MASEPSDEHESRRGDEPPDEYPGECCGATYGNAGTLKMEGGSAGRSKIDGGIDGIRAPALRSLARRFWNHVWILRGATRICTASFRLVGVSGAGLRR